MNKKQESKEEAIKSNAIGTMVNCELLLNDESKSNFEIC
jgi:hypothetical protein